MSNDLISRIALIADMRSRKYIDKALCEIFETVVDEAPTAYNVDAVCERIKNEQDKTLQKWKAADRSDYGVFSYLDGKGDAFQESIEIVRKGGEERMKRIYAITTTEGDVWGIPAEVIADNYAKYYESRGENYQENYDAMLQWFDSNDFEFADWAKDNMNWSDVKDKAFLVKRQYFGNDFDESWTNGEYEYIRED